MESDRGHEATRYPVPQLRVPHRDRGIVLAAQAKGTEITTIARLLCSIMLELPEHPIHVIAPEVGGGLGGGVGDLPAPAPYRHQLARVVIGRAVTAAMGRAG